jgi:hypothetical protein
VAGKKITVGRASVSIGPELERALDRMISTTYAEIKREVEAIASDVTEHAQAEWYLNVTERTGRTGAGIDYEMRITPTHLRGVVFSTNKDTYYVRRPGPFSTIGRRVDGPEFANVMQTYRATGQVPDGYTVGRYTRTRRPVGVFRLVARDSTRPRDGKNLWKVVVLDYGRPVIRERLTQIDKALQAAARRVAA